jgi:uncharacterized protein with GYD domain
MIAAEIKMDARCLPKAALRWQGPCLRLFACCGKGVVYAISSRLLPGSEEDSRKTWRLGSVLQKEVPATRYPNQAAYTKSGLDGLPEEGGSNHRKAVAQAAESLAGALEAFYYAFGGTDVSAILDLPDSVSASAFSLLIAAGGGATVKTTVLITPEKVGQATKETVEYRPPSGWRPPSAL